MRTIRYRHRPQGTPPQTLAPHPSARQGISLLALLGTILAVGLIATITVPHFFAQTGVTLDNASVVLAKDLRAAQQRCAFVGQAARFELARDGYRVVDPDGQTVQRYGSKELFQRSFGPRTVHEGVEIALIDLGGDGALSIDAVGLAQESGTIVLRFKNRERRLTIRPGRGLIEIEGLARNWRAEMD